MKMLLWYIVYYTTYAISLLIEYIVTFTGYYSSEAREGFIRAALHGIEGWTILVRNNPGQQYPSDFSLVKVRYVTMVVYCHGDLYLVTIW